MLEIFDYSFMVRALIAGLLIAVAIPVMGSFLVARRYSLIADSLAHMSLAGIGAGLLFGGAPLLFALPVTICGALILEWLRQNRKMSGEVSLAILMSGGLALAVVFASLAKGITTDFTSYLFGSVTTTSEADIYALLAAVALVLVVIASNYRAFLHVAFDEDSARIAGYKVTILNYVLAALTAIVVVLSLRIVGGLLVSALLVMPVIAASQFTRSFLHTIGLAVVFAVIAVVAGLVISFYAGIAAGGAIVLVALGLLIGSLIIKSN